MSIITNAKPANLDFDNIDCPYIKRVFSNFADNITMLTIQEFIHKSKYPIDSFMVDNFFVNLNDDIPIYVTNELIEWCGYSGTKEIQKRRFMEILASFKEGTDYWIYSNKEYKNCYEKSISCQTDIESNRPKPNYPHPNTFAGKNKTKHMILSVQCFKMVLMILTTSKAFNIKLHYIQMERLVLIYMKYQCIFLNKSYEKEMSKIKDLSHVKKYSRLQILGELNAALEQRHRVGCIYFICEGDNHDVVKIGYTFNLKQRLKQLQTAHYKELLVLHYYFTQNPYEEEQRLHMENKDRLIRGEWYAEPICKN